MNLIGGRLLGMGLALAMLGSLTACSNAPTASDAPSSTATPVAAKRVELPCVKSGKGATGPNAADFCWIDWAGLPLKDGTTPVSITVDGGRVDADLTIGHTTNSTLFARDYTGDRNYPLGDAYALDGHRYALGFASTDPTLWADRQATVTFTHITPVADVTGDRANVLTDFRMAFGDAEIMSGDKTNYERTDITSDKPLEKIGMVGDTDESRSYRTANTGWDTTHVVLAGGAPTRWNSYGAAVAGAKEPTSFKVDFQQKHSNGDSAIAVGLYMPYTTAYPLHYDRNGAQSGVTPQQSN